jgi:hypothetical protein
VFIVVHLFVVFWFDMLAGEFLTLEILLHLSHSMFSWIALFE